MSILGVTSLPSTTTSTLISILETMLMGASTNPFVSHFFLSKLEDTTTFLGFSRVSALTPNLREGHTEALLP